MYLFPLLKILTFTLLINKRFACINLFVFRIFVTRMKFIGLSASHDQLLQVSYLKSTLNSWNACEFVNKNYPISFQEITLSQRLNMSRDYLADFFQCTRFSTHQHFLNIRHSCLLYAIGIFCFPKLPYLVDNFFFASCK